MFLLSNEDWGWEQLCCQLYRVRIQTPTVFFLSLRSVATVLWHFPVNVTLWVEKIATGWLLQIVWVDAIILCCPFGSYIQDGYLENCWLDKFFLCHKLNLIPMQCPYFLVESHATVGKETIIWISEMLSHYTEMFEASTSSVKWR